MQSGPARGGAWGGNESLRMLVLVVLIVVHGGNTAMMNGGLVRIQNGRIEQCGQQGE
jgi:hypothetical protein